MNLGQAAKLMRTASGLRQKEVASQIGVTSNYMSLVENGKREPSVSFLRELARVLKVPVGLFFLWEEAESRPSKKGFEQLRDILAQLETMYLFANQLGRGGWRSATLQYQYDKRACEAFAGCTSRNH